VCVFVEASSRQKGTIAELEAKLECLQNENDILSAQQALLSEKATGEHSERLSSLMSQLEQQTQERAALNERVASLKYVVCVCVCVHVCMYVCVF
jgi:type II secretory pathway component PulF